VTGSTASPFPMGGMGAGMICLEGTGALSHFSLRHRPEVFNEPCTFAALAIRGRPELARVLEGPVPPWKLFGSAGTGNGAAGSSFGLPDSAKPLSRPAFPLARVTSRTRRCPWKWNLTGWSPFEPGDADNASLPVAAIEYQFTNRTRSKRRGGLLVQRQELHGASAAIPRPSKPLPVASSFGAVPATTSLGGRRILRHGVRPETQGEPGLVPGRVVGSAHHGLERHRQRRLFRSPGPHRRRTLARRFPCSSRSP
jgi:hypothetical protein